MTEMSEQMVNQHRRRLGPAPEWGFVNEGDGVEAFFFRCFVCLLKGVQHMSRQDEQVCSGIECDKMTRRMNGCHRYIPSLSTKFSTVESKPLGNGTFSRFPIKQYPTSCH